MYRLLTRMTAALDPEPRLPLRDEVPRRAPMRRSFWQVTAERFGPIPMILAFVLISIGAVAVALEFVFALTRLSI